MFENQNISYSIYLPEKIMIYCKFLLLIHIRAFINMLNTRVYLAFKEHSSWQRLLGPKKSPRKSTYIGPKVHIVATWGTIKKLNFSTPLGDSSWHALPNLPKLADILA